MSSSSSRLAWLVYSPNNECLKLENEELMNKNEKSCINNNGLKMEYEKLKMECEMAKNAGSKRWYLFY